MSNGDLMLNELSNLKAELRNKQIEVERLLGEVEGQLNAVDTTMRLYREKKGTHEPAAYKSLASELRGKSQLDALIHIASKKDGRFKVVDAKRLMLEAGLIRTAKNALSIIYTLINRSEKFDKVKPGEYRLRSDAQLPFQVKGI